MKKSPDEHNKKRRKSLRREPGFEPNVSSEAVVSTDNPMVMPKYAPNKKTCVCRIVSSEPND